ncbi:MAG: cob(I)yrinic acid a,c-diamide adenosyltransferase [bacterium]|nr:cob(I)yrinic acid a,c-diamide adenosyltransferase [bacterium]
MKIYTRKGDDGSTSLYGGRCTQKNEPRVETYGTLDELNSMIGAAQALLPQDIDLPFELKPLLEIIQKDIFIIGTHIASHPDVEKKLKSLPEFRPDGITWLEDAIDKIDDNLAPLKSFILPGGSPAGSMLHVARTVCRRAERRVVALAEKEQVDPYIMQYLNRLSDFLFDLARLVNQAEGKQELLWESK